MDRSYRPHPLLRAGPQAILTAMTAAAFAPLVVPLLGVGPSLVLDGLVAQLGNIGAGHLTNVLDGVVRRLRDEDKVVAVSEELIANLLERQLEQDLAGPHASAIWSEIARALHEVDALPTALDAAVKSGVGELHTHISRSVIVLSDTWNELRALREDLDTALVVIQSGLTHIIATQRDHNDVIKRMAIQMAIDRRQATIGRPPDPPLTTVSRDPASSDLFGIGDIHPYPGLAAFKVADAPWFHGRETLI